MAVDLNLLYAKFTGPLEWVTVPLLFSAIVFLSDFTLKPPKSQHQPLGNVLIHNPFCFSTYFQCIITLTSHNTKLKCVERVFMNSSNSPKQNQLVCSVLPYVAYPFTIDIFAVL